MNTIMLQLEVTRFLHRCESSSPSSRAATSPTSTGNSAPPTLFGGSPMKVDVACRVSYLFILFWKDLFVKTGEQCKEISLLFYKMFLILFLENALIHLAGVMLVCDVGV